MKINSSACELAPAILNVMLDAVIATDTNERISFANPAAEQLLGYQAGNVQGLAVSDVIRLIHEQSQESVKLSLERCLQQGDTLIMGDGEVLIGSRESHIPIEVRAAPLWDQQGCISGVVIVLRDYTEKRKLIKRISYEATHDSLTNLVNRKEFERRLGRLLGSVDQHHDHALLYMDLDRFKTVNDSCGHRAGDRLLREIAYLFKSNVRERDTLARLGGDEFALLLEQCPSSKARQIAKNLRVALSRYRFACQERTFELGVSIGITLIRSSGETVEELLDRADRACYEAKNKDGIRFG